MRCYYAGVGEAFDELQGNTSVVLLTDAPTQQAFAVDCGFNAAAAIWKALGKGDQLAGFHLTHFHGDHCFGVPWLLARMIEDGRTDPLFISGGIGVDEVVPRLMELAYPGFMDKAQFRIIFLEAAEGRTHEVGEFRLAYAPTAHSMPNLAIRIDVSGHSLCVSGDGAPTPALVELAKGVDLMVQEAYALEGSFAGHGTVPGAIAAAREANAKALALVHIGRKARHTQMQDILECCARAAIPVHVPEPGEFFTFHNSE